MPQHARTTLSLAAALTLTTAAVAAPKGPQLFVSPAGQPFRAPAEAPYPVAAWFAAADANRDGTLTRTELKADFAAVFDQLDRTRDGVIDGGEVTRYELVVLPEINGGVFDDRSLVGTRDTGTTGGTGSGAVPTGPQRRPGLTGIAPHNLLKSMQPLMAADANLNRQVDKAEFAKRADVVFDALDADRDGALTLGELPATQAEGKRKRR